jgi:acetyl esterase/lipase
MKPWPLVLLLTLPAAARGADGPTIVPDVVYGHKDGMALTYDVFKPAKPNGAAVLWIQSGGWYSNYTDPKALAPVGGAYYAKGITLYIVRHGSAPKYTVPEAVADVRRAVRHVRMTAKEHGVDPNRLGVTGGSAGGHLSLMLGTTGDDGNPKAKDEVLRQPSRVAAVVAILSLTAASTGLTLTRAREIVFAELPWNPQTALQAEARAYRIGQKNGLIVRYAIAPKSLDDTVWAMLDRKALTAGAVIDGDEEKHRLHLTGPSKSPVTSVLRMLFEDELRAMTAEVKPRGRWKPHVADGRTKILAA